MIYSLNFTRQALKELENPRPKGYKKIKGRDGYRIRVSDYRIIYIISSTMNSLPIIILGHRKDIYE